MRQKKLNTALVAALLAVAQAPAHAVDSGIDWLKISGFGTLAATYANIDENSGTYFRGAGNDSTGANEDWSIGTDSKFGTQFVAKINPALSATLQVLIRRDGRGQYTPKVEWANLKYDVTPDISVRVGRMGLPAFLISDYQNVGYSHPWIRPPGDAYLMKTVTPVDGVDAVFRFHFGDTNIAVQPIVGSSVLKNSLTTPIDDIKSVNVVVDNGPWTLRFANIRSTFKAPAYGLPALKDNFTNIGLAYDKDAWLVQGEFIRRTTNDNGGIFGVIKQKMGYITTGYRVGKVMPYATISRFDDQTATGVIATGQKTLAAGVRWDFYKNMDLKVQWDHITRDPGRSTLGPNVPGAIGLFNTAAGSAFASSDKAVNVMTVGVDFVF